MRSGEVWCVRMCRETGEVHIEGWEGVVRAHLSWFMLMLDLGRFFFLSALALSCMEARKTHGANVIFCVRSQTCTLCMILLHKKCRNILRTNTSLRVDQFSRSPKLGAGRIYVQGLLHVVLLRSN